MGNPKRLTKQLTPFCTGRSCHVSWVPSCLSLEVCEVFTNISCLLMSGFRCCMFYLPPIEAFHKFFLSFRASFARPAKSKDSRYKRYNNDKTTKISLESPIDLHQCIFLRREWRPNLRIQNLTLLVMNFGKSLG